MKRLFTVAFFVAAIALVCLPVQAGAKAAPGGKIVNTQGQTIEVIQFVNLVSTLPFMYQQSEQSAPLSDIKSLTNLGDGYVMLQNTKGQSFKVVVMMGAVSTGELINFKTKDPISGKPEKAQIDGEFVKQIEFNWKK